MKKSLQSPNGYLAGTPHVLLAERMFRRAFAAVEQNQVAFLRFARLHVAEGLFHTAFDGSLQALAVRIAQHLALDYEALPQVVGLAGLSRPQHQQIGAAAP